MLEIEINRRRILPKPEEYHSLGYTIVGSKFSTSQIDDLVFEVERVHSDFLTLREKFPNLVKLGEWCIKSPHLASARIRDCFFSEDFAEICCKLVGEDVDFYWSTTAHKPPESGRSFPWHQDSGYGSGPTDYITCWMALDDVDEENGCIWIIPGSHKEGILPHEFRKSNSEEYGGVFLKEKPSDSDKAVPLKLKAGEIVCLNSKIIHETRTNKSNRKRRGLISAYASVSSFEGHTLGPNELPEPFLR